MVKVAQCWDDGVVTDIRLIEILKKYNAKATFNLNPGFHGSERVVTSWRPVDHTGWSYKGFYGGKLAAGELVDIYGDFEVASHCMKHENAVTTPLKDFVKAAVDARHFLEDMFQKECPGFAWPCGDTTPESADALLEAGFIYGRTTKYTDRVEDYKHPMMLDSSCHFQASNFYTKFTEAKARNGIFYFWGHSYEMMDSEGMWNQLEDKIKLLSSDPEVVWCNVADIVR